MAAMRKATAQSGHHTGGPTCVVRAERVGGALQALLLGGEVHTGFLWSAGSLWLAGGG